MRLVPPLLLFLISNPPVVRAQSTNASLTGRITDPSKASIADVKIAAISTAINVNYNATINIFGDYSLTNLPAGTYRLEIEKPFFEKLIEPDVILHVQDAPEIDCEMTLRSGSETITVEAGAPLVNTESGTVSTVIEAGLNRVTTSSFISTWSIRAVTSQRGSSRNSSAPRSSCVQITALMQ